MRACNYMLLGLLAGATAKLQGSHATDKRSCLPPFVSCMHVDRYDAFCGCTCAVFGGCSEATFTLMFVECVALPAEHRRSLVVVAKLRSL